MIYLVRHGDANEQLTEKGRAECQAVAKMLKTCRVQIDEILHSTKRRALETARILAPDLLPIEKEGLEPNAPVAPLLPEIHSFTHNVMLVGHLPFMERLLTTLLYGEEGVCPVTFSGSCVVAVEQNKIAWVICPQLLLSA